MLRYCFLIVFILAACPVGFAQEKDSTEVNEVPNYRTPRKLYLESYADDIVIHDTYISEERQWEVDENIYIVGWSDNGLVAYVAEPPEDGCDCYFFELVIKDVDKDSIVWFYHYDNSAIDPELRYSRYRYDTRFEEKKKNPELDTIHTSLWEIWKAESNLFKHTLHHFGISNERRYFDVENPENQPSIDFDDKETNPVVRIEIPLENDTFQVSYIANGTSNLKTARFAGFVPDPNNSDRWLMFIEQRWERPENGRNSLIDYEVIGMNLFRNPTCVVQVLPEPPFSYFIRSKTPQYNPINLVKKEHSQVDSSWWELHEKEIGIRWHFGKHVNKLEQEKPLPDYIKKRMKKGNETSYLAFAIETKKEWMAFYGNAPNKFGNILDPMMLSIFEKRDSASSYCFDFSNYTYLTEEMKSDSEFVIQELRWAVANHNNVLYVSNAHRNNASTSEGKNAYITAIDMTTGKMMWRSEPKVANANNFIVAGDVIITGYGFTNEADYVYLLNKYNGKVVKKIPIESAPEWFAKKGNTLYLQTYNGEHTFEIKGKQ